jgi:hypothetical protein
MLRKLLPVVASIIGFCLMWPGVWAIIGMSDGYYPGAPVSPLSDKIVIWLGTILIWYSAIKLMWFAIKKPRH